LTRKQKIAIMNKKGVKRMCNMNDNETQQKTIRFEKEIIEKIDELRKGTERNFSQQVKFMIKKYLEIIEQK